MSKKHQSLAAIADAYDYKIPWRVFRLLGERSNLPDQNAFVSMLFELDCLVGGLAFDETGGQIYCGPAVVRHGWRRIVVEGPIEFPGDPPSQPLDGLDVRHVRLFPQANGAALPGLGALRDGVLIACHGFEEQAARPRSDELDQAGSGTRPESEDHDAEMVPRAASIGR